jgi:hypothetical protein
LIENLAPEENRLKAFTRLSFVPDPRPFYDTFDGFLPH